MYSTNSLSDRDVGYKDHPGRGGEFLWNFRSNAGALLLNGRYNIMRNIGGVRRWNLQTVLIVLLVFGTILTYINVTKLSNHVNNSQSQCSSTRGNERRKSFAIHGRRVNSGYLSHVFDTFAKLGYDRVNVTEDWDVLWAHDYPFKVLYDQMTKLKAHQRVNHFPGSGYITNKMNLATSDLPYVPRAFQLPKDKELLIKYAKNNPHKRFVQKSNNHRGIKIEKLEKLDLEKTGTFIQEYIGNPLLIDGHKFDIGVYTIITSINPLRIYIYRDVLFRFCPEPYHPFDPDVVDKYVVGDDYLPLWKVPGLQKYYTDLGFGMKDSFNAWWLSNKGKGKSVNHIWSQVESSIRTIALNKENSLIEAAKRYPPGDTRHFFEMARFDFVIDDDGNVFLMEANMSPNLSSAHFPPNALLYEQVLFNLFSVTGIASSLVHGRSTSDTVQVSSKHISVYPRECHDEKCLHDCKSSKCSLCEHCLNEETTLMLKSAYIEHLNRMDCRRVFPPTSIVKRSGNPSPTGQGLVEEHESLENYDISGLSKLNQMQIQWFRGKCLMDESFC